MPTPAYSPETHTHYDSWDDLVAAEANGWVTVVIMQRKARSSGKTETFATVYGPWPEKRKASNKGVNVRNHFKRDNVELDGTELVAVNIRPAWKD